jgi:Rubisco LSMT substrate-binding/SET domain
MFAILGRLEKAQGEDDETQRWNATSASQNMDKFRQWIESSGEFGSDGSDLKVSLSQGHDEGNGLVAKVGVEAGEVLLSVPRRLMMTTEGAVRSKTEDIEVLFDMDVVKRLPSLILALHLLDERFNVGAESFWAPYIDALPRRYSIPLFWSGAQIEALRPSPVHIKAQRIVANAVLQYCSLWQEQYASIMTSTPVFHPDHFTWRQFRWAIGAVLTRQNQIPSEDRTHAELALIPLWDMCNHAASGEITTYYNAETERLECSALSTLAPDDQVYIFYGPRPNSELLLYSGFALADNPHDATVIGVPLGDSVMEKHSVLQANKLPPPNAPLSVRTDARLNGTTIAYLRVAAANAAALEAMRSGQSPPTKQVSPQNEFAAASLFQRTCQQYARRYTPALLAAPKEPSIDKQASSSSAASSSSSNADASADDGNNESDTPPPPSADDLRRDYAILQSIHTLKRCEFTALLSTAKKLSSICDSLKK